MVMRNRNESADARRWWDDLPPGLRTRVSCPPAPHEDTQDESPSFITPGELARDLTQLTLLFFAIATAIMLFLLAAVAFIGT